VCSVVCSECFRLQIIDMVVFLSRREGDGVGAFSREMAHDLFPPSKNIRGGEVPLPHPPCRVAEYKSLANHSIPTVKNFNHHSPTPPLLIYYQSFAQLAPPLPTAPPLKEPPSPKKICAQHRHTYHLRVNSVSTSAITLNHEQ